VLRGGGGGAFETDEVEPRGGAGRQGFQGFVLNGAGVANAADDEMVVAEEVGLEETFSDACKVGVSVGQS
jgi:hypothetical protein